MEALDDRGTSSSQHSKELACLLCWIMCYTVGMDNQAQKPKPDTLEQVNQKLEKLVSFKRNLFMSIINGAGYAIGASIVAAMIITVLTWTVKSIQDVPVLNKIKLNSYESSY